MRTAHSAATFANRVDRPWHACLWMIASAMGFSTMGIFVKRLTPTIPQFELVFIRSLINFLIVFGIMWVRRENFFPPGKPLLFFRGIAGFGGIVCLFYSIGHLPLPISLLISWCSPIFVILFSGIFLKERINYSNLIWIGFAFIGLILLLQPNTSNDDGKLNTSVPLHAVAIGLVGAVCGGLAYVAVRAATAKVGVNGIILYFVGVSTLISAPLAVRDFHLPQGWTLLELLFVGLLASFGQGAMTQAYRFAPAGFVSTLGLSNVVFGAVFGWLLFDEVLHGSQWLGMVVVGVAIGCLTHSKARRSPPPVV